MSTIPIAKPTDLDQLLGTVKTLMFRKQYKRCANLCLQYLSQHGALHAAHKTALYFYAGIANDCYARAMFTRSPLLATTLDEAESLLLKAQRLVRDARIATPHSFLPNMKLQLQHHHQNQALDSEVGSLHRTHLSEDSASRPSTAATSISTYSTDTDILFYDCDDLFEKEPDVHVISPLNVRKYKPIPETPSKLATEESTSLFSVTTTSPRTSPSPGPGLAPFYLLRFPPSSPPPTEPGPAKPANVPSPPPSIWMEDDVPFPDEDSCFHEPDHVEIYNIQLAAFADMLDKHVADLRVFKVKSQASVMRALPPTQKRKMSPEERMERIVRGRECKWKRERFDPTRVQELCEAAVAEL